jgi:hypothetical protein
VDDKKLIKDMISATLLAMLQTCNSQMQCGGYWSSPVMSDGLNFHYEETALELIIAYKHSISGINETTVGRRLPDAKKSNIGVVTVSHSWLGIGFFVLWHI